MSKRASQPDTRADIALKDCLRANPPQSFIMKAGAGSGKTTSLVKALATIIDEKGSQLLAHRRRVACITYTEVAKDEIWADVGNDPLVHVATIHSFFWSFIETFQADIKFWVKTRLDEKIAELEQKAANYGPRVQQRTKDKDRRDIERHNTTKREIEKVPSFRYGTGSDYANGILGHDDIIKMVPQLLVERRLLRILLAQQYPFVFVDESQDTMEQVVQAFTAVAETNPANFCLGFFGDPMQKIYLTGIGEIPALAAWTNITKPENFRCPRTVLDVANAIRGRGDGLVQERGKMIDDGRGQLVSVPGTARLFILPADDQRDRRINDVRDWISRQNEDPAWLAGGTPDEVKILVLVHRMAAKRLGFSSLYEALNDKAPDKFKNGFQDGTAWPLRPFMSFVLPLAKAARDGQQFEVMQILRKYSPLLNPDNLVGVNIAARLAELRAGSERIRRLMDENSEATNGDILRLLHESRLVNLDPRFHVYLGLGPPPANQNNPHGGDNQGADDDESAKELAAMDAFMQCRATEFWSYQWYIQDESPFSTQQGIKGAEFTRVLVILDDQESKHFQFSYDKFFGIKPLSDRDLENIRNGDESTIDRTCRLFYVCCTRSLQDLAVVLFCNNVDAAAEHIGRLNIFTPGSIVTNLN